MTNIIVVFPKLEDAKSIRNILTRSGLTVTAVCNCGAQALAAMDDLNDGVIVCGYRFQDMFFADLYHNMPRDFEMVLVTSKMHEGDGRALGVNCITMPLKAVQLTETVGMICENIARKRRKRRQQPIKRADGDRQVLNEAKLLLMERNHMCESEAHRYIQKCSMDTGTNMVETARMILSMMR